MSLGRTIHSITSECGVYVTFEGPQVRVRITETGADLINPTDFEIEGDPAHIGEVLATAAVVIQNMKNEKNREPN